jgi:hypothetical protein
MATSKWVFIDPNGHLAYTALPRGDQIVDFSYAGYGGGGIAIPTVPVKKTVMPSGADDTMAIQAAIDEVSRLPLAGGFRGAVLLGPGSFQMGATALAINASGVVLRGSGPGNGGTILTLTGGSKFIRIRGSGTYQPTGTPTTITDAYVPSGSRTFKVASTTGLAVGDTILIDRPVTAAWLSLLGMDKLVRGGKPQTWLNVGTIIHSDRVIRAISGRQITIDVPLTDSYDEKYVSPPGVTVTRYTFPGRIEQVGLEGLRVVAPATSRGGPFLSMSAVQDGWVRDVAFTNFWNGIQVGRDAKAVTLQDLEISRTIDGARAQPADIGITGQEILVQRASSAVLDSVHFLVPGAQTPGPIVFHDFQGTGGARVDSAPHQRWATGVLYDKISTPGADIQLPNRGYFGSGHGWSAGFSVLWNCTAQNILVQQPPGSQNWAIGCIGNEQKAAPPGLPDVAVQGAVDSPGQPVTPSSLYLAQLCQRLGPKALENIGR